MASPLLRPTVSCLEELGPRLPAGPRPLTGREADAVPVLELQPALPELALALLHPGLLLAQLVDDDVELPLQDVDLPLGQLLLAAPQQLLLGLLLERGPRQLLLPGAQLLQGRKHGGEAGVLRVGGGAEGPRGPVPPYSRSQTGRGSPRWLVKESLTAPGAGCPGRAGSARPPVDRAMVALETGAEGS